jgi:dihydrofolate reductase
MLANANHVMPAALKFEGDKRFFSSALDRADLIVHGRNSGEDHPNAPKRRRIVVTHRVSSLARDPSNPRAVQWNPENASFEDACNFAGVLSGTIAIIGGPEVFGMFMDRYDTFWLSQAPRVRLPDGQACFPGVPARTPQQVLAAHGLKPGEPKMLEAGEGVTVTPWRRAVSADKT